MKVLDEMEWVALLASIVDRYPDWIDVRGLGVEDPYLRATLAYLAEKKLILIEWDYDVDPPKLVKVKATAKGVDNIRRRDLPDLIPLD